MKKFVILSYSISGVGGGQMYQKNKLSYMKKMGYNVAAVYSTPGKIIINDLKKYEDNLIELLSVNPMLLSRNQIAETIDKISRLIGSLDEDTIIEANNKTLSMWGEIIAQKYKCINFIYIIDEKIGSLDPTIIDFFKFKRNKCELCGIKGETYQMIFETDCVKDGYGYVLPLVCNNVVDDYFHPVIDSVVISDFNIGTIGRLEKAYIPTLVAEISNFAKNHQNLSITFLMIGDSPQKENIDLINSTLCNNKNITLILTGALFPIPLKLLESMDVFVSSAGSARVSASISKPTITIDARDYCSIGILNYDTYNTVFRTTEEKISISNKLDFILQNDFYKTIKLEKYNKEADDLDEIFKIHLLKFENMKNSKKYYKFSDKKIPSKRKIEKLILKLFGFNSYQKFKKVIFSKINR